MSQIIGSMGSWLGGANSAGNPNSITALSGGMAGLGEIGNILADRQRQQLLNQEKAWMNMSPQALSAKVAAATAPLSAGLTQGVGNVVQASNAEKGLAQAPGIQAATLAQALAPYAQQNQEQALQLIMRQMGLPASAAGLLPSNTSLTPLLALLQRNFQSSGSSGQLPPWAMSSFTPSVGGVYDPSLSSISYMPSSGGIYDSTNVTDIGSMTGG